eukprot:scaffold7021_cov120-Isochrysis_galbana.AAC.5
MGDGGGGACPGGWPPSPLVSSGERGPLFKAPTHSDPKGTSIFLHIFPVCIPFLGSICLVCCTRLGIGWSKYEDLIKNNGVNGH